MIDYPLIKNIHVLLALTSGLGFALRGFVRLVLQRPLNHPVLRVFPHLIDTLLLASGVALWVMAGWPLFSWLGVKLALVVAYILLGIAAFRSQVPKRSVWLYLLALGVFLMVAYTALYKPIT